MLLPFTTLYNYSEGVASAVVAWSLLDTRPQELLCVITVPGLCSIANMWSWCRHRPGPGGAGGVCRACCVNLHLKFLTCAILLHEPY